MKPLPRDIIYFSTADWDNPTWTNNQHMASRLAQHGFRILYIESLGLRKPTVSGRDMTRIFRRFIKGFRGLRKVQENLWVYSPLVVPFHSRSSVRQINRSLLKQGIHRHLRDLGFQSPLFWTYNPLTLDLTGIFNESMIIYHCVDNLAASPRLPADAIASAEARLVQQADLVFTTHPNLQAALSRLNPASTYLFPNVADYSHFSAARDPGPVPDDIASIPRPRIGFIGTLTDYKIDFECIAFIAKTRKDWHWVMIGQVGEGEPETSIDLLRKPNIHFLGPKEYQKLPDYLRAIDVAVLPNRINDYTTSMFPMKFFEYLSAGTPVVATDLPALYQYADVCAIVRNREEFVEAISVTLDGHAPAIDRRLRSARENTWEIRLDHMERILHEKWDRKNGS